MSLLLRFPNKSATVSELSPSARADLRARLAAEIEERIAILDALDGDADLEPDADDEPSLGWGLGMGIGTADDREDDASPVGRE